MDLSIIIINYKSVGHVLNCVNSIYQETHEHSFEIIIVDNNSEDESEVNIRSKFPDLIWINSGYNAGFGRANNIGIKAASGKFILLLNADTIILDNALDKAIRLFEQAPDETVGCGVQLLNPDGSHQISGAYNVKGGLNTLLPFPYLGKLIRTLGYRFKAKIPSVTSVESVQYVDWIVGAFILVKKEVLSKSGLFDEDFFMYAEEIEWCSRLKKNGKLVLFAEPKVIHIGGATSNDYYRTGENDNSKNLWNKKAKQIIVSLMLRIRKQFGVGYFLLMVFFFLAEVPVFILGLLIESSFKKRTKYSWKDVNGYISNIGTLLKYFFKILINKKYFYKVF
ncbi:glycosyltransferase family 2 protein [soil metagenome]